MKILRVTLLGVMLSCGLAAQPASLAGCPFTPSASSGANDLQGTIQVPFERNLAANITYHTHQNQVTSAFLTDSVHANLNGYNFTLNDSDYDPKTDMFIGAGELTGPGLPSHLLVSKVLFNAKGIQQVGGLTTRGWATAHRPWKVAHGTLSPHGLAWNNQTKEVDLKGLLLQGIFHAEVEAEVRAAQVVGVKLLKPVAILHQHRTAFIKAVRLEGGEIHVDGYTSDKYGKPWHFKSTLVKPDGTLAVDFPTAHTIIPAHVPAQLVPRKGFGAPLPAQASLGNVPIPTGPTPPAMFGPSSALDKALAQGLEVVPISGAPNLQMVVTQKSADGQKVDGFIPLSDWVGQCQVYGATFDGKTANVDRATMNWLKKTAHPPASGFGVIQLLNPVTLNKVNGRLNSGIAGMAQMRGMTAGLASWELDTKEFRLECGTFNAVGAKLNPLGGSAPWSMSMSTTGGAWNVASAPQVPANVPMAGPNDPINVQYQGGTEFDIVFLDGGDWGFEFRTAVPQLDIGGPEWLRTGTAKAPKGVIWPSIFAKIYNKGFVFFNFVGQGISIPINDGLALTSPGLLFNYIPSENLFFLLLQTQVTIVDVDPNIFACKGKLYVDGGGMGAPGGAGEVELSGYILNILVATFDVGFAACKHPDGVWEEKFSVTAPIMEILGFKVEISAEVHIHPAPGDYSVAASAWAHVIFFDVGLTFYGYPDGHVTFAFGAHEFHAASDGSGNSQYTGQFVVMNYNWYGTETVDTSKGSVTAVGKSKWTATGDQSTSFSADLKMNQAVVNEEGVASCDIAMSKVNISNDFSGETLSVSADTVPLMLDSSNNVLRGKIKGAQIKLKEYTGPIDVDLTIENDGTMKITFDLPAQLGGTLTEKVTVTSVGDDSQDPK
ncbi:hypothetical protein JST97_21365 [bacterium]|nr:hypothetical protein [bacterium]